MSLHRLATHRSEPRTTGSGMTSTNPTCAERTHTNRRRRGRLAVLLFALLGLGILSPTPAAAQDAPAEGLEVKGTFVLVPEESEEIAAAIEAAIKKMRFFKSIARGRLKDTNPLYRIIHIDASADTVRLAFEDETTLIAPTTDEEIEWRYNGEKFRVRTRWDSGAIRQSFAAFDGVRESITTLEPDGVTLRIATTVTSRMLPAPVKYVLVYRRAEG